MSQHVTNQHTVAQFYLRNFSSRDKKHTWCYDKLYRKIEERSIKNVASETYFYDLIPGQKKNSLEYLFAKAETDVAPIIKKIIETENINLPQDEKIVVSIFIALQLQRTKTALNDAEYINDQFMRPFKEFIEQTGAKLGFQERTPREVWLSLLYHDTPRFADALYGKLWFLMKSNKQFYTSDNPVVKTNSIVLEGRNNLGLKSDGIEIYFPITDSLAICLLCEKMFGALKRDSLALTPEVILRMNSLQVVYAERFICSSNNNFDLVIDMYSKGQV